MLTPDRAEIKLVFTGINIDRLSEQTFMQLLFHRMITVPTSPNVIIWARSKSQLHRVIEILSVLWESTISNNKHKRLAGALLAKNLPFMCHAANMKESDKHDNIRILRSPGHGVKILAPTSTLANGGPLVDCSSQLLRSLCFWTVTWCRCEPAQLY